MARLTGRPLPKAARAAVDPPAADETPPVWRLPDGSTPAFDAKEPTSSLRRRGWASGVGLVAEELADALDYAFGALAVLGLWSLRRRATRKGHLLKTYSVVFLVAVCAFAVREGYVCARHLLTVVVACTGVAGYGAWATGRWLATHVGRTTARSRRWDWPGLRQHAHAPWAYAVVTVVVIASLGHAAKSLALRRWGHRHAAQWLAEHAPRPGTVLDTTGLTGLYSGRITRTYAQAPAAFADPGLAYIVLEQGELCASSQRARTLRFLLSLAGGQPLRFSDPRHGPHDPHAVLVYPWDARRFQAWLRRQTVPVATQDRPAS